MLEIINVAMRFSMWGFALYRWAKKREEFMLFLTLALWIDSLAALAQKPIIEDLGLSPNVDVLAPLLALFAVVEGVLLLATSFYILERLNSRTHQLLLISTASIGSAYVLIGTLFGASPSALMMFSIPFVGISLMITGYALIKKEVGVKSIATLFPAGAFLLGTINITYPITIATGLAHYLYGAGAVFRVMMFIGMAKYAIFQIVPPKATAVKISPGAFYVADKGYLVKIIEKMKSAGNGVLITRSPPGEGELPFPVFWVTRVASSSPWGNVVIVRPTDMGILVDLVKRHLEKGHSIVVIDCLEYLILENSFEKALKFLLSLKDYVVKSGGTLIVATDPSTYQERQWKILERELEKLQF